MDKLKGYIGLFIVFILLLPIFLPFNTKEHPYQYVNSINFFDNTVISNLYLLDNKAYELYLQISSMQRNPECIKMGNIVEESEVKDLGLLGSVDKYGVRFENQLILPLARNDCLFWLSSYYLNTILTVEDVDELSKNESYKNLIELLEMKEENIQFRNESLEKAGISFDEYEKILLLPRSELYSDEQIEYILGAKLNDGIAIQTNFEIIQTGYDVSDEIISVLSKKINFNLYLINGIYLLICLFILINRRFVGACVVSGILVILKIIKSVHKAI